MIFMITFSPPSDSSTGVVHNLQAHKSDSSEVCSHSCMKHRYLSRPSMATFSCRWAKKVAGVSVSTTCTFSRWRKYSMKRRRKAMKCSALLMFPGTCGSASITSAHFSQHELQQAIIGRRCKKLTTPWACLHVDCKSLHMGWVCEHRTI